MHSTCLDRTVIRIPADPDLSPMPAKTRALCFDLRAHGQVSLFFEDVRSTLTQVVVARILLLAPLMTTLGLSSAQRIQTPKQYHLDA